MALTIRHAMAEDAPAIAQVHVQSWAETYPGLMPEEFLARMTGEQMRLRREHGWREQLGAGGLLTGEATTVLVAEQAGQVVAFASLGMPREHPGYDAELMTLYALRAAQGQGLGRALLVAAAREARAQGARNLALWVLDVNPTRAWYARQGAREAGEKTVPIPGGELREVRMVWDDLSGLLPGVP